MITNNFDMNILLGNAINYHDLQHILTPLKEYISLIDGLLPNTTYTDQEPYDHICSLFAKSIIDYAMAAYDNFLIGHIKASNILCRSFIENYICMRIIQKHKDIELWKYWLVHSCYHAMKNAKNDNLQKKIHQQFSSICESINIEPEFLDKKIIKKDYGWIWKISSDYNFKRLCDIVQPHAYIDYKIACDFSHGTSVFQKLYSFDEDIDILYTLSTIFIYLEYLITHCYPTRKNEQYYVLSLKLNLLFKSYVKNDD